jgi:hypothetical protein
MKDELQKKRQNLLKLRNQMKDLQSQIDEEKPSVLGSFARSAANSLVFDGGDEALAALGVGEGDTYSQRQRDLQQTIDMDYAENPIASFSGNIAGSVVPLIASLGASIYSGGATTPALAATATKTLGNAGKVAKLIASQPGTVKKALALSAGEGALSGYLGSDQDNRMTGATIGAIAAPVGSMAISGITNAGRDLLSTNVGQNLLSQIRTPALQNELKDGILKQQRNFTPIERKAIKHVANLIDKAGGDEIVDENFKRLSSDVESARLLDALGGVGAYEARRVSNLDNSVRDTVSNFVLDRHLGGNKRLALSLIHI